MRASVPTVALVSILVLGGCASSGGGSGASGSRREDPDRITLEELEPYPGRSVFEAIRSLRPRWLRVRTSRTFVSETTISVIVDGVPQDGGVERLRDISALDVRELRYLSAADATTMYGSDMAGGAILVYSRR